MNNTPAFPTGIITDGKGQIIGGSNGMSLRDYFAAQVAVGMMSDYWNSDSMRDPTFEGIARQAYDLADAMLKAREA
jgi:hypothetical protein